MVDAVALCQEYVMPDCLELKVVNDRGEVKTDLLMVSGLYMMN